MEKNPGQGVFAAGDNSLGQLWKSELKMSAQFVLCENFPCTPAQVTSISAWGQSLAVAVNASKVLFRKDNGDVKTYTIGMIKTIACIEDTVIALLTDGRIIDVIANEFYPENTYISISASTTCICAVDAEGKAWIWKGADKSSPELLIENANVIGCSDTTVYVSTNDGKVFAFEDGEQSEMHCPEQIIDIKCSDTESLFLSNSGNVYRCEFGIISQIYGISSVVSISVGPQHFACITFDGGLFTWGFNPSGQLGFGNDKPTAAPSRVLDHCVIAACGTHHTIAVKRPKCVPSLPQGFDKSKLPPTITSNSSVVTRAEMLF